MRIYEALTRAEQFQKVVLLSVAKSSVDVTSKPAEISGEPGGIFVIFGGYISGRQIELERNQRIVQDWQERVGSRRLFDRTIRTARSRNRN